MQRFEVYEIHFYHTSHNNSVISYHERASPLANRYNWRAEIVSNHLQIQNHLDSVKMPGKFDDLVNVQNQCAVGFPDENMTMPPVATAIYTN